MYVRIWRGRIHRGKENDFERVFKELALPFMKEQKDCVRVVTGRDRLSGEGRFLMVSLWRSLEGIQKMAGPGWREPVVLPEERELIREASVEHYEVLDVQDQGG